MPTRAQAIVQATRGMRGQVQELVRELRSARIQAGLPQAAVASAIGCSRALVSSIEAGLRTPGIEMLAGFAAAVGLDVSLRAYPGGSPLRDGGQLRLIARFRDQLGGHWRVRAKVPVTSDSRDRRAFDLVLARGRTQIAVEAVTRLVDAEAQTRRITLKAAASGVSCVVLLLADTRHNRAALAAGAPTLRAAFPLGPRAVTQALREGHAPGDSGVVFV